MSNTNARAHDPSSLAATAQGRLELQHQEEERNAAYHRVMALAAAQGMVGKLTLGIVTPPSSVTCGSNPNIGGDKISPYSSSQLPTSQTMPPSSTRPRRSTSGAARRRGPLRTRHSASSSMSSATYMRSGGGGGNSSDSSNHSLTGTAMTPPRYMGHPPRDRTYSSSSYVSGNGSGSDTSTCSRHNNSAGSAGEGWYSGSESAEAGYSRGSGSSVCSAMSDSPYAPSGRPGGLDPVTVWKKAAADPVVADLLRHRRERKEA